MQQRPFLALFVGPAIIVAVGIVAAMGEIGQYSLRAYQPGSLDAGGFTLANLGELGRPIFIRAFADTVRICFETALFTLLAGYPVAYALVRTRSVALKSFILIVSVTPLFLGEVVRTYSWVVVLGNTGFVNALLTKLGLVERPIQLMFTELGVIVALVHVTLPVMVIMLATALSHIDPAYERAAESLGAGPIRVFLTITLPLSMPGVVASFTTAFAWTFSAFATPQVIGGGKVSTVSTLVYQLGLSSFNFPFAATLSLAGMAVALGMLWILRRLARPLEAINVH